MAIRVDGEAEDVIINYLTDRRPVKPVFIEGLPGVGNIGKIAADYMIEKLGAEKIANIYTSYYPPQVLVNEEGVLDMVSASFYLYENEQGKQMVFLTGPYQAVDNRGHYVFSSRMVDEAASWGTEMIYTLGGYGTGKLLDNEPRVLGAVTDLSLKELLLEAGVVFSKDEPANGIVGASGLILGIAKLRGLRGACLMGETSGYILDSKAAKAIILVLSKILGFEIDFTDMDRDIENIEFLNEKLTEMENMAIQEKKKDLGYIG